VEPGESVEVQVMLQAMKEEPPLAMKCKDKFLIQSTIISPEKDTLPLQEIWSGESPEEIHSQKIRVAYLPPEGQTVPEEEEPAQPQAAVAEPPAAPSDLNGYATVQPREPEPAPPIPDFHQESPAQPAEPELHVDAPSTPPPEPPVQEEEPAQEEVPEPPAVVNVNVHTPSAPAPAPPPPPAPVVPDPNPELVAKLHEAYGEIERLRNLISAMPDPSTTVPSTVAVSASAVPTERDLRRRRGRVPSDDASTYVGSDVTSYVDDSMTQPDGVPLQIVIIVALGVFITTYLFF